MIKESNIERSARILGELAKMFPGANVYDLNGSGEHFVAEVEPAKDHPEYDRAVEVIITSQPHKHLKTTQYYTVLSGTLHLRIEDDTIILAPGETFTVEPGEVHWALSDDECWVEIISRPGWTREDHINVEY